MPPPPFLPFYKGLIRLGLRLAGRVGSGQSYPTRRVMFENLLIRPYPTRPAKFRTPPDPTRLDPRGFEKHLSRTAGRILIREKPCFFGPILRHSKRERSLSVRNLFGYELFVPQNIRENPSYLLVKTTSIHTCCCYEQIWH